MLHNEVVTTLQSRGHEIDDCDLYAERFDPVLTERERVHYLDIKLNRAPIATYADRLLAAEALILVYPVWNEGFPAILKGFFDRVFIPGVSFTVDADGALTTNLRKLRKIAAVCTYGATRTINLLLGDPPKRVVKRMVRWMPGHRVRCEAPTISPFSLLIGEIVMEISTRLPSLRCRTVSPKDIRRVPMSSQGL